MEYSRIYGTLLNYIIMFILIYMIPANWLIIEHLKFVLSLNLYLTILLYEFWTKFKTNIDG